MKQCSAYWSGQRY